jgi:serine protease Do
MHTMAISSVSKLRWKSQCTILMVVLAMSSTIYASQSTLQDRVDQDPTNRRATDPNQQVQSGDAAVQIDDRLQAPPLGVRVMDSPGQGVHVAQSFWGSPAERAGIQQGDYIMAINDKAVSTPEELRACVTNVPPDQVVVITVWRDGEEFSAQTHLASQNKEVPKSHRAWLGVVLTPYRQGDVTGISVNQVYPGSPAQKSGLRDGDVIVKVDEQDVSRINDLLTCFEKHGPNEGCSITVARQGETVPVKLSFGDVSNADEQWMEMAYRPPMDADDLQRTWTSRGNSDSDLRSEVDRLHYEIRELRNQMRALHPGEMQGRRNDRRPTREGEIDNNRNRRNPDRTQGGGGSDDSQSNFDASVSLPQITPTSSVSGTTTVQDDDYWAKQRRYQQYRNYGNYYYPYQRYGYRNYRRGYQYSQPYYRNWYYNYNGRNYYYNGYDYNGNYYGPRSGLRLGNDWGIYWY